MKVTKRSFALFILSNILDITAFAGEPAVSPSPSPTPEPRFKISAWIDAGITINPAAPDDRQNFGRLFDDRSNEPVVNQIALNLERTLSPEPGELDWGFKLQMLFGTDARYIHSLGLMDNTMATSLYQPDLAEAYLNLHFPVLTQGGLDVKLGKFVTPVGFESIDPRSNIFYSHNYIFNFGVPFYHTGALFTLHANSWLDLLGGITRGANTSIDDNNHSVSFLAGFGMNLNGGKLSLNGATSIGPETPDDNHDFRYLSDIYLTWKITGKWTSITELNFTRDDAANANGYGGAQYFTYAITDRFTAKMRAEIWRDEKGFYVTSFADPHDPVRALEGEPVIDPRTVGGGRTTYGALTLGLDIKPPVPKPLSGLTLRPEIRYDRSLGNTRPFNDSSDRDQFTAGMDCVVTF